MTVGERIGRRRLEIGWSQVQLADAAELTSSAVSLFESNKRKPSFNALQKLSAALKVSTDYFTDEYRPEAATTTDPRLRTLADGYALLDETGRDQMAGQLLQLIARRGGGSQEVTYPGDPQLAARSLLEQLGLRYLPIDPFLVAALLGLSVRMVNLEATDHEARLELYEGAPLMLIGRSEQFSENRLRFTAAHLIAHVILGHRRNRTYLCRTLLSSADEDDLESQAHAFAAELLVPGSVVDKLGVDTTKDRHSHPSIDQALIWANRCKASVPVSALQYARHSTFPCATLLTEGGRIRQVATSASFALTLRSELPNDALCLTTMAERGVRRRDCPAVTWINSDVDGVLVEEAYHYGPAAQQSVTVLSLSRGQ